MPLLESTSCGNRPVRRANPVNDLRTTNLSPDLHVALFRARFMRGFRNGLNHPDARGPPSPVPIVFSQLLHVQQVLTGALAGAAGSRCQGRTTGRHIDN